MRAQLGLLEHMIGPWDAEEIFFRVGEHILTLEIDDVYFLTGLSQRGDHVNLVGKRPSRLTTKALIHTHYKDGGKKSGGKITITNVAYFPLKEILYTITRETGSASCHVAMKSHMFYAIDCTKPRVVNWFDGVLRNMRE